MDYNKDYLYLVKPFLKNTRYIHTLGVISEAVTYAKKYNVDINKARIAATLHDICKYFSIEDSKRLILRYYTIDEYNKIPEGSIHSYAAAIYSKDYIGIDDIEILDAIKYHTLGRTRMTPLEKIIYLADFSDPSRNEPYTKEIHDMALIDIDKALYNSMKVVYLDVSTRVNRPSEESLKETKERLEYYRKIVNE